MKLKTSITTLIILLIILSQSISVKAYSNQTLMDKTKLSTQINNYIEERKVGTAGVSIGVFNGQETIYQTNYGYSNIEERIKVDHNTVYEWGSVSKMLVWTSVMQLYEKGDIDLNADIRNYLPEGFLNKLKFDTPITLINLMNHTSGFQDTLYFPETQDEGKIITLKDALLKFQPTQIYKPGEVCSYSNWGTALAAYIVEIVSGLPYHEYVKENIFDVLGMDHTALLPNWGDNSWVSKKRKEISSYAIYEDSFTSLGNTISYILLYPAGSTTGTLDDFIRFGKAFVPNEGEKSPLFNSRNTLDTFVTATSYYKNSNIPRVNHGLWSLPYGNGVIGHSGNTNGFSSSLYFDPDTNIGIVIMTNEVGETSYNYGLLSVVFGDYNAPSDEITEIKDLSGIYTSSRTVIDKGFGRIYKYIGMIMPLIKTEDPKVHKLFLGQGTLTQISDQIFIMDNENGMKSIKNIATEPNERIKFEAYTMDEMQENLILFWGRIGLFILFFIAILWSLIHFAINLIKDLVNFIRKKKPLLYKKQNSQMLIDLSAVGLGLTVFMLLFGEGTVSIYNAAIKCIIIMIFTTIICICGIIELFNKKKKNHVFSSKFSIMVSFIILINVLYWQWYNFWSY